MDTNQESEVSLDDVAGLLGDEIDEELDEETWQRYASGSLDEPCHECRSTGKVSVLDEDKLSPEARELVKEWRESFYENQAEQWAERFC